MDGLSDRDRKLLLRLEPNDFKEALSEREDLSRGQRRALERDYEKEFADRKRWANTTTTRKDVMWMLGRYTESKIMPLASNLDALGREVQQLRTMMAYLVQPWYVRLWIAVRDRSRALWHSATARIIWTRKEDDDGDADPGDLPDGGDDGSEGHLAGSGAEGLRAEDRAEGVPPAGAGPG